MRVVLAVAAVLLFACGGSKPQPDSVPPETPQCPEAAALPCLTPPVCKYDAARGCKSCRCEAPAYVPPERTEPH